jgi:hypothetical protein
MKRPTDQNVQNGLSEIRRNGCGDSYPARTPRTQVTDADWQKELRGLRGILETWARAQGRRGLFVVASG